MTCNICKEAMSDSSKEICQQCEELWPKAKKWFSDGEIDVDLMIDAGVIKRLLLIQMYKKEFSL